MAYTPTDYVSALKQSAPYIKVDQPLMDELGRVSQQGLTPDEVVKNGITNGGYADNLRAGAQDYLNQQYQPQLAAAQSQYATGNQTAQDNAATETNAATLANDRLTRQLQYTYDQNRQNDPLSRMGVRSGASQNYQTDQEANNLYDANQGLQGTLSGIAKNLSNARNANAATLQGVQGTVGGQIGAGTTDIMNNALNSSVLRSVTPSGSTYQVGNNTYAGSNQGTGLLNLMQNPSLVRLASSAASNPQLMPILNTLFQQYGISVTPAQEKAFVASAAGQGSQAGQAGAPNPKDPAGVF